MNEITFKEKFIGFVDILGFKGLVKAAEEGTGMPLVEILDLVKILGTSEDRMEFVKFGPLVCPKSRYIQRDLDFQITQISDCVVVSSEVSPAGLINLINHCFSVVIKLMNQGIMCRGYITQGSVYHIDKQIIGTGYQEAYRKESSVTAFKREADERGTPFIEIDPVISDFVRSHGDSCVRKMFSRYIKDDGIVKALFPFLRLQHSFTGGNLHGHKFNPEKERESNKNMHLMIEKMKENVMAFVDRSKPDAIQKAEHYILALDAQLDVCKTTAGIIDRLCTSFPKGHERVN
jgi:hypothetical protein